VTPTLISKASSASSANFTCRSWWRDLRFAGLGMDVDDYTVVVTALSAVSAGQRKS
jgi:hypothetical protein